MNLHEFLWLLIGLVAGLVLAPLIDAAEKRFKHFFTSRRANLYDRLK